MTHEPDTDDAPDPADLLPDPKTIHAYRIDADFYDIVFGGDGAKMSGNWALIVSLARKHQVAQVKINNQKFRHVGEPATVVVSAAQLHRSGWTHILEP